MNVRAGKKTVKLDPAAVIGKGGEAEIYRIDAGTVLKLYKTPDHIDYTGQPHEQAAARRRLGLLQTKLLDFPQGLPQRVVQPVELALDDAGRIAGYTMRFIDGADVLARYADRSYCFGRVTRKLVAKLFRDLHATVGGIHTGKVVIGDFNDLNVLVAQDGTCWLVDADSFQYGPYACSLYTEKFVDPRHCDPAKGVLAPARPPAADSDWYAYTAMLMQSLVYVGPYGGVHRPASGHPVPQRERPLKRLTVFDSEVRYPKPALPLDSVPTPVLDYLRDVFVDDRREAFPLALLDVLDGACPAAAARRAPSAPPVIVRGQVTVQRFFSTNGRIVAAACQHGKLLWLYHEADEYRREDGHMVFRGPDLANLHAMLRGPDTIVVRASDGAAPASMIVAGPAGQERHTVDMRGQPALTANSHSFYWVDGGLLRQWRMGDMNPRLIGRVLANQTLIWAGERFGFGFCRAGNLDMQFVFSADRGGINDAMDPIPIPGVVRGAVCRFDGDRCWFFVSEDQGTRVVNRCVVLRANGRVEAQAEDEDGSGGWLGRITGKCPLNGALLSAADDGIVRLEVRSGGIEPVRHFPDTEPFVDCETSLFPAAGGLLAVSGDEITRLEIA